MKRALRRGVAGTLTAILATTLCPQDARASSSDELVQMGKRREASGETNVALRNYMDALRLDPSFEPAYLALGALREKLGDVREAERTYAVAIEHAPSATAPFVELAKLWWRVGREEDGNALLWRLGEARATEVLAELAEHFEQRARPMRALVVWRRVASLARTRNEAPLATRAQAEALALTKFVRELDPATHPASPTLPRTTLAQIR